MSKKVLFINLAVVIILLEIIFRIFLSSVLGTDFLSTFSILEKGFYHLDNISSDKKADISILILGGSVLYKDTVILMHRCSICWKTVCRNP